MTENQNGLVQPLDKTIADLSALRGSRDNTWRKIAAMDKYQGIPAGTLCAILKHGREPKKPEHRRILGLPPVAVPTEPCPIHGEVHCYNCQTEQVKPIESKPSINRKAAQPSPDDIVSFTVKMTRAQREQINATAKGRGVTTKEMICNEYLEGEK